MDNEQSGKVGVERKEAKLMQRRSRGGENYVKGEHLVYFFYMGVSQSGRRE